VNEKPVKLFLIFKESTKQEEMKCLIEKKIERFSFANTVT
jgi:hypothetical protein